MRECMYLESREREREEGEERGKKDGGKVKGGEEERECMYFKRG